jgi:serine/threonine protein phosphatase PrpC
MLPPPRISTEAHEAESASTAGTSHVISTDAVGIFALDLPYEGWHGLMLCVADGKGYADLGDLASAAVLDAFEDGLQERSDQLGLDTGGWQRLVGQAVSAAFDHANARVRALLERRWAEPAQGVGLAAAGLIGNWLCVATAGGGQVLRLGRGGLEALAPARLGPNRPSSPPLGVVSQARPAIAFYRARPGDVVLVCSEGLIQAVDRDRIAGLLGSFDPAADIARSLIRAGEDAGAEADVSAAVLRIRAVPRRSLPGALHRLASSPGEVTQSTARLTSSWQHILLAASIGLGSLAGGATLVRRLVLSSAQRELAPVVLTLTPHVATIVAPDPPTPAVTLAAAEVTEPPFAESPPVALHRNRPAPAQSAAQPRLPIRRETSPIPSDPQPLLRTAAESDSMSPRMTASATVPDTAAAAAEARRVARDSSERVAAVAEARRAHLTAGYRSLSNWLGALMASANRAESDAPVLAAGPAEFVAFINRDHPALSGERLVTSQVDDAQGTATAEWQAQWKTAFGTTTSRRMRATLTIVAHEDEWTLERWTLTDGAP